MSMTTYSGAITIKIFANLQQDYLNEFNNSTLKVLADHTHEGSGSGNPIHGTNAIQASTITAASIADGTITSAKLAASISLTVLANNTYLKWRNAANSADLNIIKTNTSDRIELEKDIDKFRMANNVPFKGSTVAAADHNMFKVNASDQWEWLNTAYTQNALAKTDATYSLGDATHRYVDAYLSGGAYIGGTTSINKLTDFEQDGWTPTIVGSTTAGTGTYTTQEGVYLKIGKLVIATFALTWTAHTGGGDIYIGGIPFPADSVNQFIGHPSPVVIQNATFAGAIVWYTAARFTDSLFSIFGPQSAASGVGISLDPAATINGTLIYRTTS